MIFAVFCHEVDDDVVVDGDKVDDDDFFLIFSDK